MLKRILTDKYELNAIQDNVDIELTKIQKSPLTNGKILEGVDLTSGTDNLISHGLGYVPRLVLPMVPNLDTRIWSPTTASLNGASASNQYVNLRCSATCTVDVWVT